MTETKEQLLPPPTGIKDAIQLFRNALTNKDVLHEPWTSGVIPLERSESTLFYKRQDGTSNFIDLSTITSTQAEDLSAACQPATFGLNQQDILDLSYRKAGKIDVGDFIWGFNPDSGVFTEKVASGLFPWQSLDKGIRFEPYKLNVYGEGSFFKAHQDTPRNQDMFGSLVVVLPFPHKGGDLLLRHHGRQLTFDGFGLIHDVTIPSVAYIAFFSDIEHEVTPVESGHRVTITYNIYFDATKGVPVPQTPVEAQPEHPFKTALRTYLASADLHGHPSLGFGLDHTYPFESAIKKPGKLKLKGSDATLIRILTELDLECCFYLLYFEPSYRGKKGDCPFRVLSQVIVNGNNDYGDWEFKGPFDMIALKEDGAFLVWDEDPEEVKKKNCDLYSQWYNYYRRKTDNYQNLRVKWVTEPKEYVDRSISVAYGNEPSLGYFYHQLCVIVTIDPEEVEEYDTGDEESDGSEFNY